MTSPLSRAGHWFYGQAYLLLSLNMLFWAGNTVLGRFMAGHFPPVAMAWCRWTLAAAILLPFAWPHLRRDLPELRRGLPILAALSLTGIAAYNTMVYYGLQYTSALNGSLLQSTAPLLIGVWTFLLFGDRLTGRQVAGIVLSLVGVVVIITRADPDLLMHLELNRGDVWIVAALASYALYSALLRLRPEVHWLSLIFATFVLGNVMLTPLLIWELSAGHAMTFDAETVLSLLYFGIFPSILAYVFFNRGVELIGANRVGPFFHLLPLFGVIMSIVFLGERLQAFHLAGFAAIVSGIALAARRPKGAPPPG